MPITTPQLSSSSGGVNSGKTPIDRDRALKYWHQNSPASLCHAEPLERTRRLTIAAREDRAGELSFSCALLPTCGLPLVAETVEHDELPGSDAIALLFQDGVWEAFRDRGIAVLAMPPRVGTCSPEPPRPRLQPLCAMKLVFVLPSGAVRHPKCGRLRKAGRACLLVSLDTRRLRAPAIHVNARLIRSNR